MCGGFPNSRNTEPRRRANDLREECALSHCFGIISMQAVWFEYFAKKFADHILASPSKQGIYRRSAKKIGCVHPAGTTPRLDDGRLQPRLHYERHFRNPFPIVRSYPQC